MDYDGVVDARLSPLFTAAGEVRCRTRVRLAAVSPHQKGEGVLEATPYAGSLGAKPQKVTEAEEKLLKVIGSHVAGPRFMMNVDAEPDTLELLDELIARGLVASTGRVLRQPSGPIVPVCLTGKGWVRYNERRKQ